MSEIVVLKNGKRKDKPIRHLKDGQTGGPEDEDLQINVIMCPAVIRWRETQCILSKHKPPRHSCNDILLSFMWNHEP